MTEPTLTLENWRDEYYDRCQVERDGSYKKDHLMKDCPYQKDGTPWDYPESCHELDARKIADFIDQLLTLQKEEAIKRIEEEKKNEGSDMYWSAYDTGLYQAQDIIRKL